MNLTIGFHIARELLRGEIIEMEHDGDMRQGDRRERQRSENEECGEEIDYKEEKHYQEKESIFEDDKDL